jgi:hypothetical protein
MGKWDAKANAVIQSITDSNAAAPMKVPMRPIIIRKTNNKVAGHNFDSVDQKNM